MSSQVPRSTLEELANQLNQVIYKAMQNPQTRQASRAPATRSCPHFGGGPRNTLTAQWTIPTAS